MTPQFPKLNETRTGVGPSVFMARSLFAHELIEENKAEVLRFLAERPLHTVVMSGFVRDNGIESWLNRGTFYGCRDDLGHLEGVALIGHAMFIDARSNEAIAVFASLAQDVGSTHMIMGEQETIQRFWNYYSAGGQAPRLFCREVLFEQTSPFDTFAPVPGLRLASLDDLSLIVPVHAALAYDESGVNPLDLDRDGFRMRCARRVRKDRVWVWVERGELIFKADVISDTPEAIYLEGIYVAPGERGKDYGSRCLAQIARSLLTRTQAIVLLVNEEHRAAQSFFQKIGFVRRGLYDTIFLHEKHNEAQSTPTLTKQNIPER
jgi:predicted GNAT family acetyltransferase